jgi:hypothetical protein
MMPHPPHSGEEKENSLSPFFLFYLSSSGQRREEKEKSSFPPFPFPFFLLWARGGREGDKDKKRECKQGE